ncbi:hypothetical protein [Ilumatobacter sp.]|uniref:hypothetical protein n=1 Tax=Ilumatobacter sp. TaxID=1967498 RepID=UPI003AF5D617
MTGNSARMRRRLTSLLAVTAVGIGAVAAVPPADTVSAVAPRSQRVVMFTDSVGLGAEFALPRAFPPDWQVRVDGRPAEMVGEMEHNFVRPRLRTNPDWFGDHVVIAAGYNFSHWDHPRFVSEVDSMVNTLTAAGVKHVYWMTLREIKPQYVSAGAWRQIQPYSWYFPDVNRLLEEALERHPNLHLVDWRAVADRPGITYDAIHLNNDGAALFSNIIRAKVDGVTTSVPDGSTTRISVPNANGAIAAAVNVTTTDPRSAGFVTLHPCNGPPPVVSMHNHRRDEVVAHAGVVPLDGNGDFCATTRVSTNLIVDVTGLFRPDSGFTAPPPTRWLDTRNSAGRAPVPAGGEVVLDFDEIRSRVGYSGDPRAVVVVVTAAEASAPGWLRVGTCGDDAETSNVNYSDAAAVPNLAVVEPDADGRICVTTLAESHVVVDLFGIFDEGSAVEADRAVRWTDTRELGAKVAAGSETRFDTTVEGFGWSDGAVINVTAVNTEAPGFITVYPCGDERPTTSMLNTGPGLVVSNASIAAPNDDQILCIYSLSATDLVVDMMGSIDDSFAPLVPIRVLDTRG